MSETTRLAKARHASRRAAQAHWHINSTLDDLAANTASSVKREVYAHEASRAALTAIEMEADVEDITQRLQQLHADYAQPQDLTTDEMSGHEGPSEISLPGSGSPA